MLTRFTDVASDGVSVNARQSRGLAGADSLGHVSEDIDHFVGRQSGVEQSGALAFGEASLAGGAPQESNPVGAVSRGHGEVAVSALAAIGAVGVPTAKRTEVVHDDPAESDGQSSQETGEFTKIEPYNDRGTLPPRSMRHFQ